MPYSKYDMYYIKVDLPYNISTQKEVESWIKKYLTL
jgi:hypothetical protein